MILADINSGSRLHGGRTIFQGLSWSLRLGEKIGLIGPSGCGKSTLLRLFAGVDQPDSGSVTTRKGTTVAYLPQEYAGTPGRSAIDELLASRADLAAIDEAILAAEHRMSDPNVVADPDAFDALILEHEHLLERFAAAGGPMLRNRAEGLLRELGFAEADRSLQMEVLSGGQRKLIGIIRCMLADPDVLLLDEPDNHLDLERKAALERLIRNFDGAVIVVSHDRYLLDETVETIVELEPHRAEGVRLTRWEGNYTAYVAQKELALVRQQQDFASQQKEIARLEAAVARFKLWARIVVDERHIKQARNKQRQIDRMEKVDRPVLERRRMSLRFRAGTRGGAKAVELRDVQKHFGDNVILRGARATIMNGECIGIVGPNGAGKSVLLKLMLGSLEPDAGAVWVGPSIRLARYAQEHETLNFAQTAVEALREVKPMLEAEAVSQLGRFLLPYDAVRKPIATLSGGEKSRVQLARLMFSDANCLLLDEPTNNLDIAAAEVLEDALERFTGTVVVVSHDRYLLDRLADRIIEVRDGGLRIFEGGYSYYVEQTSR